MLTAKEYAAQVRALLTDKDADCETTYTSPVNAKSKLRIWHFVSDGKRVTSVIEEDEAAGMTREQIIEALADRFGFYLANDDDGGAARSDVVRRLDDGQFTTDPLPASSPPS